MSFLLVPHTLSLNLAAEPYVAVIKSKTRIKFYQLSHARIFSVLKCPKIFLVCLPFVVVKAQ